MTIKQLGRTTWLAGMFLALGLVWSMPVLAQAVVPSSSSSEASVELPDPLTPEAIDALVARLSDAEVRDLLLQQLDRMADPSASADDDGLVHSLAHDIAPCID